VRKVADGCAKEIRTRKPSLMPMAISRICELLTNDEDPGHLPGVFVVAADDDQDGS